MTMLDKVSEFATEIRSMCEEKKMEYIDAVIHWCELNKVEVEYAASLINQDAIMRLHIQIEAENLNFIKRDGAKLPL
jgi:hypothetical protein